MSTLPPRTPENVRTLREQAGWSLEEIREQLYLSDRQTWRKYEDGTYQISESLWELAHIKAGLHPDFVLVSRSAIKNSL